MSLINLLNEQQREQEIYDVKSTGRTIISAAAVGGTAYLLSQNINLKSGIEKTYGTLKNSSAGGSELGRAGAAIRRDATTAKAVIEESRKESLRKFKDTVLSDSRLDDLFKETSSPEEARAFLSALFDSADSEMVDDSSVLDDTIRKLYEDVGSGKTIEQKDKDTVINFYKNNIASSGVKLEEFKKRHNLMMRTKGQFDTTLKKFSKEGTNTIDFKVASVDSLDRKAKAKLSDLKRWAPGKNVQLVSIEEFANQKLGTSYYARIEHGGRFQNVALSLARDKNTGMAIIRGTENLSTRYTVSSGVIDARRLFPELNIDSLSAPGGDINKAFNNATMSVEDHLFNMIKENRGSFLNFNTRNINQFNDYIRSMSLETPRTTIEGLNRSRSVNGRTVKLIDDDVIDALSESRRIQSSTQRIVGLERFASRDRENVTKRILEYNNQLYSGTAGSQTLTSRFQDPFDLDRQLVVGHIIRKVDENNDLMPTSMNMMKRYGHMDASMNPQTARSVQNIGRPELAKGFVGADEDAVFGRGRRDPATGKIIQGSQLRMSGMGSELIGVSRGDVAKRTRGVNLGAIMVFEKASQAVHGGKVVQNPAAMLGLGEGMSYIGSTIKIKKGYTKTVNYEGVNQSKLLTEVLAAAKDTNRGFLTIGSKANGDDYDIDDFFKQFGDDEGRAVLGKQDDRIIHIKRHQGMRRFTLGLSETSRETGRDRYHLKGFIEQDARHNKLFSSFAKDSTLTVSEKSMMQKLNELGLEDVGKVYFDEHGFGGKVANTLLTSTAQVGKSAQYLRIQIHGGMRMLGTDEQALNNLLDDTMKQLNDKDKLLAEVNSSLLQKEPYITELDQITVKQRSASTLGKFFESISERAAIEGVKKEHFSMVMSFAQYQAEEGKFGLNINYFQKKVREGLKKGDSSLSDTQIDDYLKAIDEMSKRAVVIGATHASVGTPHTDLGRGVAKVEPRFANFLYSSLRSFWGMDAKEATGYVSSMITRMEGFESRASGFLGMKITQESLGKLGAKEIQGQISGLEDVRKLTKDEAEELLSFGQGREREVVEKLSERRSGNILDLEDMGLSKKAMEALTGLTGGKKEIFLPGEDTFKGFIGHEIRSADEIIKVEAEYGRSITDLLSSLSSLKDAESDSDQIANAIRGFKKVRSSMSKTTATAIRHALSGRVLGSGSYMGGGFSTGKGASHIGATVFSDNPIKQASMAAGLSEVINKEMGYVAFMDQQAFLDGMTKYESAIEKHLASQGSVSTKKETSRIMRETLEAFFTGMHMGKKEGISGTVQRNPLLGFSHIFASMGIYQYDFTEELKPLEFLRSVEGGTEFTDNYAEHLKEIRKALNQDKVSEILKGVSGLETPEQREAIYKYSEELYEARKELSDQRATLKATTGYEEFVETREFLMDQRKKASEVLESPGGFIERRQGVFSGKLPKNSNLDLLAADVGAAQAARHKKVDILKEEYELLKRQILDEIDEMEKIRLASGRSSEKYIDKASEVRSIDLEIIAINDKIDKINTQIVAAEQNIPTYGRAVLGGGDVSEGNVRRSLEREFRETIEDLGQYGAMLEGESRPYFSRRGFRHFQNKNEAIQFVNNMGDFFGFSRDGFSGLSNEILNKRFSGELKIHKESGLLLHPFEEMAMPNINGRTKINMNREMLSKRIKQIRSGGELFVNLNLATKEELMSIKGIGSSYADEIIRVRNEGMILNEEDLYSRTSGMNPSQRTRLRNVVKKAAEGLVSFLPEATKIDAYEAIRSESRGEPVDRAEMRTRARRFYGNRAASQRATKLIDEMDKSPLRSVQERRQTLFEEIERNLELEEENKVRKDAIKAAQAEAKASGEDLTIRDIDEMIMKGDPRLEDIDTDFAGARTQPRAPGVSKTLQTLDEALGREVKTGADLAELRKMKESGGLTEGQSRAYDRIYKRMLGAHTQRGDFGGGIIRFPQIELSMQLKNQATGATTNYSGRMDFVRFAIGDFDADTFQVFFDTDKTLRNKVKSGEVDPTKLYTYGAQFLTNMSILGEGVGKLGARMGASQMTVAQSLVDEYQKEQIVKGVGGLDVHVKAGMLGLAQAAADDSSGDFANQFKRMQAGASLISVAQEVLGIKGKKLPIAANISREYLGALKTSYETGSGDALKAFFKEKVLKGTIMETGSGNVRVDPKSIQFHNLDETGEAAKRFKQALTNLDMNVDEMFETFDIMAKNVNKYGLNKFTSNAALGRMLEGSNRMNAQQLFGLLNKGMSMEGGAILGEMEELESIFGKLDAAKETFASSISRSKGFAGIVAGGLLGSYAIGANSDIGSLEPGGKFSDSRSKEALKAGQSLSNRALQQSFSREHGNVNPGRVSGLDNFYERPINNGVSTVSLNRSIRMYGEAPSLSTAQTMGKHFISAGGQASLTINDNRQPLGAAYINKMIRD